MFGFRGGYGAGRVEFGNTTLKKDDAAANAMRHRRRRPRRCGRPPSGRAAREEISTAARIAPTMATPAPTRNARSKPLVNATAELWTPAWNRLWVRLLRDGREVSRARARRPDLLGRVDQPEARRAGAAWFRSRRDRHGHKRPSEPDCASSDGRARRAACRGLRALVRTTEGRRRAAAVRDQGWFEPTRVTSCEAAPAEMMIRPRVAGRRSPS